MNVNDILFDSNGRLRSGWRFAIFCVGFIALLVFLSSAVFALPRAVPIDLYRLADRSILLASALMVGWLCAKYLENLPFSSLGAAFTKGWLRHLSVGLLIGTGSIGLAVLIAYVSGGLRFETNAVDTAALWRGMGVSFVLLAVAAAAEEALFRGYIFQTFARSNLVWLAITLTSVFFGAVHLRNPDWGVISTLNTILAGIWFSLAYLKTRDLWFVTGLHFMWNWVQGALFGIEISGTTDLVSTPLMREIDSGPAWLTGSTYGIEGGIATTVALVASMVLIYFLPLKTDEEIATLTSAGSV